MLSTFVKRPKWNADVIIFSDCMKHIKGTVRVASIWPLVVSLSLTRNEPGLFPGANRRRSVSLRLMPLKNHLEQKTEPSLYHSSQIQFAKQMWRSKNADIIRNSLTAVDWIWLLPADKIKNILPTFTSSYQNVCVFSSFLKCFKNIFWIVWMLREHSIL